MSSANPKSTSSPPFEGTKGCSHAARVFQAFLRVEAKDFKYASTDIKTKTKKFKYNDTTLNREQKAMSPPRKQAVLLRIYIRPFHSTQSFPPSFVVLLWLGVSLPP